MSQRCHKTCFFKSSLSLSYYGTEIPSRSDQEKMEGGGKIPSGMNEGRHEWSSNRVKKSDGKSNGKKRGGRLAKEMRRVSRCSDSRG